MPKICVVGEADPFIVQLLRRFGVECGLKIVATSVGQAVLDLAHQLQPEAIVVALELPGTLRGWQVVEVLLSDGATANIPVIACSWLSETEARRLAGPVAGYLHKPDLHYAEFLAALKKAGVELAGEETRRSQARFTEHF